VYTPFCPGLVNVLAITTPDAVGVTAPDKSAGTLNIWKVMLPVPLLQGAIKIEYVPVCGSVCVSTNEPFEKTAVEYKVEPSGF
jgi:hypothetical protein